MVSEPPEVLHLWGGDTIVVEPGQDGYEYLRGPECISDFEQVSPDEAFSRCVPRRGLKRRPRPPDSQ